MFGIFIIAMALRISTHTLRGERDALENDMKNKTAISTHTLRGERDIIDNIRCPKTAISTHTLRGERDLTLA